MWRNRLCKQCKFWKCTPTTAITAVRQNHHKCLQVLISAGIDVNMVDRKDISLIEYAVDCNCYECLKMLLENGATIRDSCKKKNIIQNAIFLGASIDIIKLLLEYKIHGKNYLDTRGYSPYHNICFYNRQDLLPLVPILKEKLDINYAEKRKSLYLVAFTICNNDIIECFLDYGLSLQLEKGLLSIFYFFVLSNYTNIILKCLDSRDFTNYKSLLDESLIKSIKYYNFKVSKKLEEKGAELYHYELKQEGDLPPILDVRVIGMHDYFYYGKNIARLLLSKSHLLFDQRFYDRHLWLIIFRYVATFFYG